MEKLTKEQIVELLKKIENSGTVQVNEYEMTENIFIDETVEGKEIALEVTWGDSEGYYDFQSQFTMEAFENCIVKGNTIDIKDSLGEDAIIKVYNLEKTKLD